MILSSNASTYVISIGWAVSALAPSVLYSDSVETRQTEEKSLTG